MESIQGSQFEEIRMTPMGDLVEIKTNNFNLILPKRRGKYSKCGGN